MSDEEENDLVLEDDLVVPEQLDEEQRSFWSKSAKKQDDNVKTVAAARNFDQMKRGQEVTVDVSEKYWSDNLRSGNVVVVD